MADKTVGERNTVQRLAITQTIRSAAGPLTVDEIHQHARAHHDNLGIATVYRTVKLLLEAEEIQAVVLPDGQTRYEAADLGHHHHFRCRACGRVFDLEGCPVKLADGLVPAGFVVEEHELTLIGICAECSRGAGE